MDFLIFNENIKNGTVELCPDYLCQKSNDLMIRGHRFYAIWNPDVGMWQQDKDKATEMIDAAVDKELEKRKEAYPGGRFKAKKLLVASTGMMAKWNTYCKELAEDNFKPLNQKVLFSNSKVNKRDYASKTLPYPLQPGSTEAYDALMKVIYSDEERHKIEWTIGAVVNGDNKNLQKFLVLYGGPGTGKSTVLNIIEMLFDGYYSVFDAEALGDRNNQFALQPFTSNPVVAIQHDGDLSRLETNTRLNSLVSHEYMVVNPKGDPAYTDRFFSILFIGTNKPVKITDAKSGILRRLIDVSPTGDKVPYSEYKTLMNQIKFELGAIAYHCLEVYLENPDYYDNYIPTQMMGASNDFYNYISEYYFVFKEDDQTSLKQAWELYKAYCAEARVLYPFSQRVFKEELKNYFDLYFERYTDEDGNRIRSYYKGFKSNKFESIVNEGPISKKDGWLKFKKQASLLDEAFKSYPAQYANDEGTPAQKWMNVTTKLKDIDTSKLHYVKIPLNQIFIDFDIKDENGNKSFKKNLEEANKWPKTYAELSKSGEGIHLHYLYEGDPSQLANLYADDIEIKVLSGNSSLRRKLTKCNDIPIAAINSGLPLKGDKTKMLTAKSIKSQKALENLIIRNLHKEIHPSTKSSIDFIYKILEDAYASDLEYDVSNLKGAVFDFAAKSTNHADYCTKLVMSMKFKSEEKPQFDVPTSKDILVFYDVEVFPNLLLINWMEDRDDAKVVRMINPSPSDVAKLTEYKLVGFNNLRYDNHILYARMLGQSEEEIYDLSRRIINGDKTAFYSQAKRISYTDVYDFTSLKQSLKKYEIDLGIHHQELGLPWDKPVPEEMWSKVAEYCDNDVIATRAVFKAREADFIGRQILAAITGMTVNDSTNSLTTRLIFGEDRNPQIFFNYRDLSKPVRPSEETFALYGNGPFRIFNKNGDPIYKDYIPGVSEDIPEGYSILPFFPGYEYKNGVSTYLDETMGEGGRVYSEPGIYYHVWDGDIASMHPNSIIQERLFGKYTDRFKELVQARIYIKHKQFKEASKLFDGKLAPYLTDEKAAKQLSNALKIAINSVYGLTSAKFDNPFRDIRNVDNIVAKRGALFMTKLKDQVQRRLYDVCHIKTDSIKIPEASDGIKEFVINFGKEYGYTFETEADFDRFAIVNDAVYVAKYKEPLKDDKTGDDIWWTATGTQFQVPYVFKTLFSKEEIQFEDLCETKSVTKGSLYLDMNETLGPEAHNYIFVGRIGQFCPIKPGCGGGILYRMNEDKYYAAAGTKGYRWLESEIIRQNNNMAVIDRSYYDKLVNDAIDTINKYGDCYEFINGPAPYFNPSVSLLSDELPF